MKGTFIKLRSSNPYLKAFATKSGGRVNIMLMNQEKDKTVDFDFSNMNEESKIAEVSIFSDAEVNVSHKVCIDADSTIIYLFNEAGELEEQVEYTMEMTRKNLPPKKQ